jgi:hypothetical protein
MYDRTESCASIDGRLGEFFKTENGVAQGDTLSPVLFSLFINGMLEEVQAQQLDMAIDHTWMGALMFADDYVGICETGDDLQLMIDALHAYARRYRFQDNVQKCVVVVFGDSTLPTPSWHWGGRQYLLNPPMCTLVSSLRMHVHGMLTRWPLWLQVLLS